MPDVNQAHRTYTSTLRERQAAATRQAVLDAARDLFLAQGYGATTIDQIAARAQVSKPTVFTAVGNKQALLAAVRAVALAGEDLPGAASSGEPALRDMWDASQQQRLTAARSFIAALADKGPLREGLDARTAADIMWLLMAPENYRDLTVERGWSRAAYQRWLADTLTAALLPPRAPGPETGDSARHA